MSKTLKEMIPDIPRRYVEQLSTEDLRAISEGRDYEVSVSGLDILKKGKEDLGAGEFIDVGGAIAGAGIGAAYGSALGPVGTAVGGVIGAAIGTFGGEVTEDVIADREIQLGFQEGGAAREASIGVAFDLAFLGAGKAVRGYRAFRKANQSMQELGEEFKPVLDVVNAAPDSPESLAQAQDFLLQQGGPSLSPLATQSASMMTQIGREIGEIGIVSSRYVERDIEKAKDIVLDNFTRFSNQNLAQTASELGKQVVQLKSAADVSMHKIYGSQLESLKSLRSARQFVSAEPLVQSLREFQEKNQIEAVMPFEGMVRRSKLDPQAESFIQNLVSELSGSVDGRYAKFRLGSIIEYDKRINDEISKMAPGSNYGNGVARRQLKELHESIRKSTINIMRQEDPAMAKIYQKMQKEYSNGLDFLDTATVDNLIKNGFNKDAYQAIGRGLIEIKNPEKTKDILKLAERSIITKARTRPNMDVKSEINKLRETVRASMLKELNLVENSPVGREKAIQNIFTSTTGAVRLLDNSESMKVVFGERWPEFKKLLNHVVAMSRRRNQEVFSLAQRSAEISSIQSIAAGTAALTGLGTGAAVGSVGAALAGLSGAGLILGAPILLYKLTSRPSLVNKYIALDNNLQKKAMSSSPEQIAELVMSNLSKLLNELSEEDVLDIRQSVSDPNYRLSSSNQ